MAASVTVDQAPGDAVLAAAEEQRETLFDALALLDSAGGALDRSLSQDGPLTEDQVNHVHRLLRLAAKEVRQAVSRFEQFV